MRSIQRALRFVPIVVAIVVASVPAPALAATGKPDVVHQQFATTGADLGVINICGDPGGLRSSRPKAHTRASTWATACSISRSPPVARTP